MKVDKVKYLKQNGISLLVALFQWLITTIFQTDRYFFSYDHITKYYVITKVFYLLFLIVLWSEIFAVFRHLKEKDNFYVREIQIFGVYFSVMFAILLIVWPGTWSWDDLIILNDVRYYSSFDDWQHIISGIYYDVLLQIFPFPGGIIFIQTVIISVCVAYSVTKLESHFMIRKSMIEKHVIKNIKWSPIDVLIKVIPFLMPPVLMYQFSGYRMGIYIYIELVLLIILICDGKELSKWNWKKLITVCVLTVIVATWRTEAVLYVPVVVLIIWFADKSSAVYKKIVGTAIVVLLFALVNISQGYESGDQDYLLISVMNPGVELVRNADPVEDARDLEAIDKVTSIEIIMENQDKCGENIYWFTDCVRNKNDNLNDDYTHEDFKNYLWANVRLAVKYPKVFLKERYNVFIDATSILELSYTNSVQSSTLYDRHNGNVMAWIMQDTDKFGYKPLFTDFRKTFIAILGGNRADGVVAQLIKWLLWNAMIPIIVLVYMWFRLLVKKKWYELLLASALLVKLPIVFLTEPLGWIMYLLPFYLCGYVYLLYKLLMAISKKKNNK